MKKYFHTADAVFALLLFCAFAFSVMLVLVLGAGEYKDVRDEIERHYSEDTALDYIAMKSRHYDSSDIFITSWVYASDSETPGAAIDVLCMSETIDGIEYINALYCRDGYLREIYADSDDLFYCRPGYTAPDPDADMINEGGECIVPISSLSVRRIDGTQLVEVTCRGTSGAAASVIIPAAHADADILSVMSAERGASE